MNSHEVKDLLATVEIAPWYRELTWNVQGLLTMAIKGDKPYNHEMGNWNTEALQDGPIARFRIEYIEEDTDTKVLSWQIARWWYVDRDMAAEAVIKTAWLALQVSDEHRRREGFRVGGTLLFNPHASIHWPTPEGAAHD